MGTDTDTMAVLDRFLAASPEKINIPTDVDRDILADFTDSTMSGLERLERATLAFEAGQTSGDDFIHTAERILHNIKGESGIMNFTEISNICHHAESLLYKNSNNIPVDTLLSIKDWLDRAMQFLIKIRPELSEYLFCTQSRRILSSAKIDLFDLGHGTSDAQAVRALSARMEKITKLAAQIGNAEARGLAKKAIDLLDEIKNAGQCVISDAYKESLFEIIDVLCKATSR